MLEIERAALGQWRRVLAGAVLNRRITAQTPMTVAGPAAVDPRLQGEVRGTLSNCAGGVTPWRTVLSGEENFNQYFDAPDGVSEEHAGPFARYGIARSGFSDRRWSETDPRFNLSQRPGEAYKFGWVVEIDPFDPGSVPKKRTMLGRIKHEGAEMALTPDDRVAVYMGDDQADEYLYKFVSRDRYRRGDSPANRQHNSTLLDHGTLYVAALGGDGASGTSVDPPYDGGGVWIPLTDDARSFVPGFSVPDVLINTRLAADVVGATKMDRPEDVQPNPVTGAVYMSLTNNADRRVSAPGAPLTSSHVRPDRGGPLVSQAGNRNGYVLELREAGGHGAATSFTWQLLLVCGDPDAPETYFAGYPKSDVSPISHPDNIAFDVQGNLWIATDGAELGVNDGLFVVPVQGPERGLVRQFLSVPTGAECTGPVLSRDDRTVFVAVQHPGETDGSTFDRPSSAWPHDDDKLYPRPAVVCVWRPDGQPIGT